MGQVITRFVLSFFHFKILLYLPTFLSITKRKLHPSGKPVKFHFQKGAFTYPDSVCEGKFWYSHMSWAPPHRLGSLSNCCPASPPTLSSKNWITRVMSPVFISPCQGSSLVRKCRKRKPYSISWLEGASFLKMPRFESCCFYLAFLLLIFDLGPAIPQKTL